MYAWGINDFGQVRFCKLLASVCCVSVQITLCTLMRSQRQQLMPPPMPVCPQFCSEWQPQNSKHQIILYEML